MKFSLNALFLILLACGFLACHRAPAPPSVPPAAADQPAATQTPAEAASAPSTAPAEAPPAMAGASTSPQDGGNGNRPDPAQRAQQRLDRMKSNLGLTDDQAQKIQAIFESQRPAMEALRADTTLSREDRRAKMHDIRQAMDAQISQVLTPDQQTKWQAERQTRGQGAGGGGGWGGSGPGGNGGFPAAAPSAATPPVDATTPTAAPTPASTTPAPQN